MSNFLPFCFRAPVPPDTWQKDVEGKPLQEPYPIGKSVIYFILVSMALNQMTRCFHILKF